MWNLWIRYINVNIKIDFQNFIPTLKNFDIKCTTFSKTSGNWWRENKGIDWKRKPTKKNSRNCYEIEFDCSWSHETIDFVSKLDIWVLHVFKEKDLLRRIDICDLLLKREENDLFLKRIVTGDKKWIVYDNVKRKSSNSQRKALWKPTFIKRKWYSLFDGISKELFFFLISTWQLYD